MMDIKTKTYSKYATQEPRENLKEKLDYLKRAIDPRYLLESLGFTIEHETPKEIRGMCIVHGGDNRTAFRFNKETRTWVCFTRKCHEVFGNDIIGLIKATQKIDFVEAVEYLQRLVGDVGSVDYNRFKRRVEMDSFMRSYDETTIKPKSVNDNSLKSFMEYRSAHFIKEGFDKNTLDLFEVAGGWKDKHGLIRDIIPIRDDIGQLVAYSLRDLRDIDDDSGKYILTPGFDKDNCLYNLNIARKYGKELPIIVVEGFKSVWRLHDYGINNVVAVMGSKIVEGQQQLLIQYAHKGIVIFFDNDEAGVLGVEKALKDLGDKLDVRPVFIQEVDGNGKGLDPADLNKRQVYEYLKSYYKLEE